MALERARQFNRDSGDIVREAIVDKAKLLKHEPLTVFKFFAELLLVFLIALGIFIWLDPTLNLIPFPLNAILFGFAIVVLGYLHFILKPKEEF